MTKIVPGMYALSALVALVAVGCNDKPDPQPGSAGSGGKTGGVGGAGRGGSGGVPGHVCIVDFPCFGSTARCVGDRQLQPYRDVSCHEICGDGPCSGGACRPSGDIVDCPLGQRCRELTIPSGYSSAECVATDDAGECDKLEDAGAASCPSLRGCGDGRIDNGRLELCDDGNRSDGDGCDRNCKVE